MAKFSKNTARFEISLSSNKNIVIFVTGDWESADIEFLHIWLARIGLSAPNIRLQSDGRVRGRKYAKVIIPPAVKA